MNEEIINNEASEDYPLGGLIEPHDIQLEQELLDKDEVFDLMDMFKINK